MNHIKTCGTVSGILEKMETRLARDKALEKYFAELKK